MRQRVASIFSFLILVVGLNASAQVAQFLAIKGEGTASIILDQPNTSPVGRTAYITDGGHGGHLGLGGAKINDKDILQYLLDEHTTRLVITCSHPHADHMGGLKKAIRDPRIKRFAEIIFIDNGYDKAGSLSEYFNKQWGSSRDGLPKVSYVPAATSDAFAGLAWQDAAVKVSNFIYNPEDIPSSEGEDALHGRSIITQYDIGDTTRTIRVVDLDDASSPLIAKWAGQKPPPRLNVLISAHHGSAKNDISPILDLRKTLGDELELTDVIITVNAENRHGHPSPEVLLRFLNDFDPEHVFITGSEGGKNVEITPSGVKGGESKEEHLERIASFIETRLDLHMGICRELVELAHSRAEQRGGAKKIFTKSLAKRVEALGTQNLLTSAERSTLKRSISSVATLEKALSKVRITIDRKSSLATLFDPLLLPPAPEGWKPDGSAGDGTEAYRTTNAASSSETQLTPLDRKVRFEQERALEKPTWGGIILGNTVSYTGPKPVDLRFLPDEDEVATQLISATGPKKKSGLSSHTTSIAILQLRVTFADGTIASLGGLTPTELWAAYNFVQPSAELNVSPHSIGLIGCHDRGTWHKCDIHPAIANTYIARDAIRLDLTFVPDNPPAFVRGIVDAPKRFGYQWYDAPARVRTFAGRLQVQPTIEPMECFMRLKVNTHIYPAWFNPSTAKDSAHAEMARRRQGEFGNLVEGLPEYLDDSVNRKILKQMQAELDASPRRSFEPPPNRLRTLCQAFDAYRSLDRLARLIALLNWYIDQSGQSLPALPQSVAPNPLTVPASWPNSVVFAAAK